MPNGERVAPQEGNNMPGPVIDQLTIISATTGAGVEDPDGCAAGLMSPVDESFRSAPPL